MEIEISHHAQYRFDTRGGFGLDIIHELAHAVPFGKPAGYSRLLKMPCGLIAVLEQRPNQVPVIVTVLTRLMASEQNAKVGQGKHRPGRDRMAVVRRLVLAELKGVGDDE